MIPERIYAEQVEIDRRLLPFEFTQAELIEVGKKTFAERSNWVEGADVLSAQGHLAYIHGSRHLRLLALSKGYKVYRENNIEASLHEPSGTMIVYQNVDLACSKFRSPKAISGKRSGSAEIIERAQGRLFLPEEIPEVVDVDSIGALNSTIWYFCVSFSDDSFNAELSLPASIKGDNFGIFPERIFIAEGHDWIGNPSEISEDDYAQLEPKISRK